MQNFTAHTMQVTIPLKIKKIAPEGCHLFFNGSIENKRIRFLIDTGASKSVIDRTFTETWLKHIQIHETEHQTTGLGATYNKSSFGRFRRIYFREFKIHPVKFAVLDLKGVNEAYQAIKMKPVQAIIGGDLLRKYYAVIDYGKAEMTIRID